MAYMSVHLRVLMAQRWCDMAQVQQVRDGGSSRERTSRKLATSLRKELGLVSISRCCISASSMYVLRGVTHVW